MGNITYLVFSLRKIIAYSCDNANRKNAILAKNPLRIAPEGTVSVK